MLGRVFASSKLRQKQRAQTVSLDILRHKVHIETVSARVNVLEEHLESLKLERDKAFDEIESLSLQISTLEQKVTLYERTIHCVVCFVTSRNIVLIPCWHVIMCSRCANRVEQCPMCDKLITGRVPIFVS